MAITTPLPFFFVFFCLQVVKEYQKRQQDYKDDVKKKVTRQVRIVKEDATEEDIEAVMQGGGSTEQLLQQAILTTANDSVKEAFEKAQDKYRYCILLKGVAFIVVVFAGTPRGNSANKEPHQKTVLLCRTTLTLVVVDSPL